jgi:hypothetical protein
VSGGTIRRPAGRTGVAAVGPGIRARVGILGATTIRRRILDGPRIRVLRRIVITIRIHALPERIARHPLRTRIIALAGDDVSAHTLAALAGLAFATTSPLSAGTTLGHRTFALGIFPGVADLLLGAELTIHTTLTDALGGADRTHRAVGVAVTTGLARLRPTPGGDNHHRREREYRERPGDP